MPTDYDPRRPDENRQQKHTLVLLVIIAGLLLAMVAAVAIQRFV